MLQMAKNNTSGRGDHFCSFFRLFMMLRHCKAFKIAVFTPPLRVRRQATLNQLSNSSIQRVSRRQRPLST